MHLDELRRVYSKKWKKSTREVGTIRYLGHIVPHTQPWKMTESVKISKTPRKDQTKIIGKSYDYF